MEEVVEEEEEGNPEMREIDWQSRPLFMHRLTCEEAVFGPTTLYSILVVSPTTLYCTVLLVFPSICSPLLGGNWMSAYFVFFCKIIRMSNKIYFLKISNYLQPQDNNIIMWFAAAL